MTTTSLGPCPWLIEQRNPLLDEGDWIPTSKEDMTVVVECGAPTSDTSWPGGLTGWACERGHEHVPIEIAWTDPAYFGDD